MQAHRFVTSFWISPSGFQITLRRRTYASLTGRLLDSDTEGLHPTKRVKLHTDEATARNLLPFRIDVALLANNHAVDCLKTGLDKTITFLNDVGIATVGAGRTAREAEQPLHLEIREVPITILNYLDEITIPTIPAVAGVYLNPLDPNRVIDEVRRWSRENRVVLVNFHWGIEFTPCPTPEHRAFARRVVEAGASVVAGHHPHRLQGHEHWKDGHIFYSLGNFLFGQPSQRNRWPRDLSTYCGRDVRN